MSWSQLFSINHGKPKASLRTLIISLNLALQAGLSGDEVEQIARVIERKKASEQDWELSLTVPTSFHGLTPQNRLDPFYWTRYRKLLVQQGLPKDVVYFARQSNDTILSRLVIQICFSSGTGAGWLLVTYRAAKRRITTVYLQGGRCRISPHHRYRRNS